jgi:Ca2+-binding RTX toxin-like protein
MFGGAGDDYINGGLGSDLLNGGLGADTFYFGGGTGDWIQDYDAAEGDILEIFKGKYKGSFTVEQTNIEGAGQAGVDEIVIIGVWSNHAVWTLVDGAAQTSLLVNSAGYQFDLLA